MTDIGFSKRMKDLLRFYLDFDLNDVELLKIGRHFRLSPYTKLIVGRNQTENGHLLNLVKDDDICFSPQQVNGPIGIGRGSFEYNSLVELATSIIARYCDNSKAKVRIDIKKDPLTKTQTIESPLIEESRLKTLII